MADIDRSNRKRGGRRYISVDAAETPLGLGKNAFLSADFTQALEHFKDAVQKGYREAYYFLGLMYNEGLGVLEDHQTAITYWKEGKSKGDELCTLSLMEESEFQNTYNMIDSEEAIKALERMEEDSFYGFQLTRMCNDYDSFLLDGDQKLNCLERCAGENNILAHFELYNFYQLDGRVEDAKRELEEAAKLHYPKAMIKMGDCYAEENDLDKAKDQYKKAISHGIMKANLPLGKIFFNQKQYQNAKAYIGRAAMSGEAEAMFIYGLMYKNGWGVRQNVDEADKWIQKAAENGYAAAREYLEEQQPDTPKVHDITAVDTNIHAADTQVNTNQQAYKPATEDIMPVKDTIRNATSRYAEFIDQMYAAGLKQRDVAKKVVEKIIGGKIIKGWQFSPNIDPAIIAKANTSFAGRNIPVDVLAFLDDAVIPPLKGKTGVMITKSKWIASPDKRVPLENISQVTVAGKIMDIVCTDGTNLQYESKKTLTDEQIIESLIYALVYNAKNYKS